MPREEVDEDLEAVEFDEGGEDEGDNDEDDEEATRQGRRGEILEEDDRSHPWDSTADVSLPPDCLLACLY